MGQLQGYVTWLVDNGIIDLQGPSQLQKYMTIYDLR